MHVALKCCAMRRCEKLCKIERLIARPAAESSWGDWLSTDHCIWARRATSKSNKIRYGLEQETLQGDG